MIMKFREAMPLLQHTLPTFQDVRDLLLKVLNLEGREETERAQVEGHDGRDGLLEEGGGVEQRAVAAEAHDEVDLVGEVVLALGERHQLVLDVREAGVVDEQGVLHHGGLDEDDLETWVIKAEDLKIVYRQFVHPPCSSRR